MNKCEFCENSKNVDGKFICKTEFSTCAYAIRRMDDFISKTEPFEKCKYCAYATYQRNSFECSIGYNSKFCRDAIELIKEMEKNDGK